MTRRSFGFRKSEHAYREKIGRSNAAFYLQGARARLKHGQCSAALDEALRGASLIGYSAAERQGARRDRSSNELSVRGMRDLRRIGKQLDRCFKTRR